MTKITDGKHNIIVSCCMWNPRCKQYSEDFKIWGDIDTLTVDNIENIIQQALDWKHCRAEWRFEDDPCQRRTVIINGMKIDDGFLPDFCAP